MIAERNDRSSAFFTGGENGSRSLHRAGSWSPTGSLVGFSAGRSGHTAVLLTSGKVLVTSLTGTNLPGNPEVYDPVAGTWSATTGPSYQVPTYSTAVQLPSGNVLILGGYPSSGAFAIGSELYNPTTNSTTLGPNLSHIRQYYSATLLTTGLALIAGGGLTFQGSGRNGRPRFASIT